MAAPRSIPVPPLRPAAFAASQSTVLPAHAAPAFTLLETLATVSLLTVAACLALSSLSGADTAARWTEARATIHRADAHARAEARMNGPTAIAIDSGSLTITRPHGQSDLPPIPLPLGFTAALTTPDGLPVSQVNIDAAGRSDDYTITASHAASSRAWLVRGRTGWLTERKDAAP